MSGRADDPLTTPAPSFPPDEAARIADREFDTAGTATELGGERDQNFRIDAESGESFVLKIANAAEDAAVLDLQTSAMEHIAATDPELPVMETVPTTDGDPWTSIEAADGTTHLVRLFTYMPGRIAAAGELDHPALRAFGRTVARTGRALQGFFHPDARYEILWDLRHTPRLRDRLDSVWDDDRRALAERVLDRFDDRVAPMFDSLRAGVIHNDLTFSNVLVGDDDRVSGILDFGDVTHTALVCDLAIALASVMFGHDDPVGAAQSVIRGYSGVIDLRPDERRVLGDLVAARLAAWGVIAAWRVEKYPENAAYITSGEDEAWALLRTLDGRGWDAVGRKLRTAARSGDVPYGSMPTDELESRRRRIMGRSPISYDDPIHVLDGDGVWLFGAEGERYLDAYNNVQVVGHANPAVAAAIAGQARTLATNTRYLHEAVVELGERLTASMPAGLDTAIFVNSGSEAVDLAWRLAGAATGNGGAVVTDNAYHGITDATTALSPEVWPDGYRPGHVTRVPPRAADSPRTITDIIGRLNDRGHDPAALVVDPVCTSDGIRPPPSGALGELAAAVREAGGLVVADEVQAGFGRTGTMWGFEGTGLEPDVVGLGKPMGNGHPVGAVVTSDAIADGLFDRTGVFSTFGGNPVSCAAALAVLDEIDARELRDRARTTGAYLRNGLEALGSSSPVVTAVRGAGLMVGVELERDGEPATAVTREIVDGLRRRNVLIGTTGPDGNVLKIRPPLVFSREHADRLLEALESVLEELGV